MTTDRIMTVLVCLFFTLVGAYIGVLGIWLVTR